MVNEFCATFLFKDVNLMRRSELSATFFVVQKVSETNLVRRNVAISINQLSATNLVQQSKISSRQKYPFKFGHFFRTSNFWQKCRSDRIAICVEIFARKGIESCLQFLPGTDAPQKRETGGLQKGEKINQASASGSSQQANPCRRKDEEVALKGEYGQVPLHDEQADWAENASQGAGEEFEDENNNALTRVDRRQGNDDADALFRDAGDASVSTNSRTIGQEQQKLHHTSIWNARIIPDDSVSSAVFLWWTDHPPSSCSNLSR